MGIKEKGFSKKEYHSYSLAWLIILLGWLVVVNYLSNKFFFRLDLTEGKAYTLSPATKQVLSDLKEPVWIRAYFSSDLPGRAGSDKRPSGGISDLWQGKGKDRNSQSGPGPETSG